MEKQIYEGWYKLGGAQIEDLEGYIFNQFAERTVGKVHDLEIIIGTDAAVRGFGKAGKGKKEARKRAINYMTVIVFKKGNTGSHVIFRRHQQVMTGFIPTAVKLNGEINLTSQLCLWMMESLNIQPTVHLDLNPKKDAGSFQVYNYIKGYFEGLGLKVAYKPLAPAATAIADFYV